MDDTLKQSMFWSVSLSQWALAGQGVGVSERKQERACNSTGVVVLSSDIPLCMLGSCMPSPLGLIWPYQHPALSIQECRYNFLVMVGEGGSLAQERRLWLQCEPPKIHLVMPTFLNTLHTEPVWAWKIDREGGGGLSPPRPYPNPRAISSTS